MREKAGDQVGIGFSFASDWLRERRTFLRPITERGKAKPIQSRITYDTPFKIAQRLTCIPIHYSHFRQKRNQTYRNINQQRDHSKKEGICSVIGIGRQMRDEISR